MFTPAKTTAANLQSPVGGLLVNVCFVVVFFFFLAIVFYKFAVLQSLELGNFQRIKINTQSSCHHRCNSTFYLFYIQLHQKCRGSLSHSLSLLFPLLIFLLFSPLLFPLLSPLSLTHMCIFHSQRFASC